MPLRHTFVAALLFLAVEPATADTALLPGDGARGKTLHAAQCVGCHDASVYTRKNRRVQSIGGLIKQVEMCNQQLQKELSHEQMNDLVAYLNETYYRFQ